MAKNVVTKIVFERDGKEHNAYPVSEEKLNEVKEDLLGKGLDIHNCPCKQDVCLNGYWWICTYDLNNKCQ